MPMESEFKNACSKIEEHCGEYLVIAKFGDGLIWKESCSTFGVGAATRYLSVMDEKERHNQRVELQNDKSEDD